jgi:hypothetical protein
MQPTCLLSLTAQVVLIALVGDTFVINLGMDLFRPVPDLVNRYVFARRAKTQARAGLSVPCAPVLRQAHVPRFACLLSYGPCAPNNHRRK